jgi:UDP-N-acetylmuramate dehydrogenase
MAEDATYRELLKQVAEVERQYPLQRFSPLKAGGVADFFTVAKDTVELASAVKAALDAKVPYVVMGQGAGLLVSDGGFPGLVIQNVSSSFAVAADKSQVVADSGLPLSRFITMLASRSLAGLTGLYGEPGTVGGAAYSGLSDGYQSVLSSVRYLTMFMPPARIDKEATIARYKTDWLAREDGLTRLQAAKAGKGVGEAQPVILTVLFQLTSVRPDEIQLRLQEQSRRSPAVSEGMGPVFASLPDADVQGLLVGAGVASLRVGSVFPDRYHPNVLRSKGAARSADIRQLIEEMQEKVASVYGVRLACRYEFAGVW